MPSKYVTVDGVATLIHHRGATTLPGQPPDTSRGHTILCLHDAGGNGNVFRGLLDHLAENHSPLSYDQPGHGRSADLDSLGSIEAMAAHASGLISTLGLGSVVLVGDGLGAAVALEVAKSGSAAAVVLVGGATGVPSGLDAMVDQLAEITAGRARREFDRTGYAPDTPRHVYQAAFGEWVKTDPRATLGDRRAQQAWTAEPGGVACPVLVLTGEHEEDDSEAGAEALAAALSAGSCAQVVGAGRRGVSEQPAALAITIDEFLAEVLS
ncbi:MAG: alpha/beta hydrolase [Actinomycetia bacterium]|nr:alpha/beta hydrolase [Actinomycetes bacterium]MCP4084568.1 alpha/beta hydrolase [Actinomycetes bacterium]